MNLSRRQEYQEKYVKIKEIKTEIDDVFWLFEELKEEVNNQSSELNTIEDNVDKIQSIITESETTITQTSENISYNNYISIGSVIVGALILFSKYFIIN